MKKNYSLYLIYCIALLPAMLFRNFTFSEMPFLFAAQKLSASGILSPEIKEMTFPPIGNMLTLSSSYSSFGSFSTFSIQFCALLFSVINAEIIFQICARQFSQKTGGIARCIFLLLSIFAFFNLQVDMILAFLIIALIALIWLAFRIFTKKGFVAQTDNGELPKFVKYAAYTIFALTFLFGLILPKINPNISYQPICERILELDDENNKINVIYCHGVTNHKEFKMFLKKPMADLNELNDLLAVVPNSVLVFQENTGIAIGLTLGKKIEKFGKYHLVDLRFK